MLEQKLSYEPKKRSWLRNAVIGLTVGLAALVGGCEGCGESSGEGRIGFSSYGTDADSLYTMKKDGMDVKELSISIDRALGRSIFCVAPKKKVVFYMNDKDRGLYSANLDGSNIQKMNCLIKGESIKGYVDWISSSAEGKRLAIVYWNKVYIFNVKNSNLEETSSIPADRDILGFALSPDGNKVAYSVGNALYVIDINTSEKHRIFDSPSETSIQEGISWSPDGKKIAYTWGKFGWGIGYNDKNIFVIDSTGGASTQITQGDVRNMNPSWSRDGKKIIFERQRGGSKTLVLIDIENKTEIILPTDGRLGNGFPFSY